MNFSFWRGWNKINKIYYESPVKIPFLLTNSVHNLATLRVLQLCWKWTKHERGGGDASVYPVFITLMDCTVYIVPLFEFMFPIAASYNRIYSSPDQLLLYQVLKSSWNALNSGNTGHVNINRVTCSDLWHESCRYSPEHAHMKLRTGFLIILIDTYIWNSQ